jgi:histone-lysine N-methyltransferase SETMAR
MTAKLTNCTKVEQRSFIRFLWAEGVPGAQIHLSMCAQYGDKVLSHTIVYEWIEMFENGRTSVTDTERSGRPATATTTRNEERTLELIRENRRLTVEEVAGRLNVSVGSAYSLIHDSLKFSKVCARWVPKELTEERKRKRLDICSRHLARYREEGDNFLQQIVTGDETWIHHYKPESKR